MEIELTNNKIMNHIVCLFLAEIHKEMLFHAKTHANNKINKNVSDINISNIEDIFN